MPVPPQESADERELLADRAVQVVRIAILDGTLMPGEQLPDSAMSAWLGISRATLRRAYTQLEHSGLVEQRPHRSVRVARSSRAAATDSFCTLSAITRGTAILAITAGDPIALEHVGTVLARGAELARSRDVDALGRAGRRVLVGLAAATGNPLLTALATNSLDGMWFHIRSRWATAEPFDWDGLAVALDDLGAALRHREVPRAVAASEALGALGRPMNGASDNVVVRTTDRSL